MLSAECNWIELVDATGCEWRMEALIEQTLARSAKVKALSEEKGNSSEIKELLNAMRTGFGALIHNYYH